jgi:negative regulator of flagellin synthesis FlgM
MKIGTSPDVAAAAVAADKPAASAAASAGGGAAVAGARKAPEASATIELSSAATALMSGVPDDGSFDVQKVGRITQAITDGKFTVDAEAIADKLIANAQEVLSRAQPH